MAIRSYELNKLLASLTIDQLGQLVHEDFEVTEIASIDKVDEGNKVIYRVEAIANLGHDMFLAEITIYSDKQESLITETRVVEFLT